MKPFFSRYAHWITVFITGFSFSTMFINPSYTKMDIIALIFGGAGFISIAYLAFLSEKQKNKKQ